MKPRYSLTSDYNSSCIRHTEHYMYVLFYAFTVRMKPFVRVWSPIYSWKKVQSRSLEKPKEEKKNLAVSVTNWMPSNEGIFSQVLRVIYFQIVLLHTKKMSGCMWPLHYLPALSAAKPPQSLLVITSKPTLNCESFEENMPYLFFYILWPLIKQPVWVDYNGKQKRLGKRIWSVHNLTKYL